MPMDATLLAKQLWDLNGPVLNGQGVPQPPSKAMVDYAKGIVAMLKAGIVSHLPGTVQGSTSPGGPLKQGMANGGKIAGLLGPTMAAIASKSNPAISPMILLEANAIATYIMTSALVVFAPGTVQGTSTETSESPKPLILGKADGGKIVKLVGASMASMVNSLTGGAGKGPTQIAHYTTICTHIMTMALVTYKKGCVTGTCYGTLNPGAAAGGKIS